MKSKEIAQWVISNRYPRSENDKVGDFEMFHHLADEIQLLADLQTEAGIKKALEVLTADLSAMPGYTSPYREAVKRINPAAILQQVKEEGEGK